MSDQTARTAVMPSVAEPRVPVGTKVALLVSKGPAERPVAASDIPDVVGKKQAIALEALQAAGFQVEVVRSANAHFKEGLISHQLPVGGSTASAGSRVCIISSTGRAPEESAMAALPEVVGKGRVEAAEIVESAGLIATVIEDFSKTAPEGVVFGQEPNPRTADRTPAKKAPLWLWAILLVAIVAVGTYLLFFTGERVAVPDVTGMLQAEAEAAITEAGLKVGDITEEAAEEAEVGTVLSQNPAAGKEVAKGSRVDLIVAGGAQYVAVPDLVHMSLELAEQELEDAGLVVGRVTEETADDEEPDTVLSQSPKAGEEVALGSRIDLVVARGREGAEVPDVVGSPIAEATEKIEDAELMVRIEEVFSADVEAGLVIAQSPQAGKRVESGTEVALSVSRGPEPAANIQVPDVVGRTQVDARTRLEQAGLTVRIVQTHHENVPAGKVIAQSPGGGSGVARGTAVAIVVSRGAPPAGTEYIKVVDVVNMTYDKAEAALMTAGFAVNKIETASASTPKGKVFGQVPLAGQKAPKGSVVLIVVSTGEPAE